MFCKLLFKNRHQNIIFVFKQCFYCNMRLNGVIEISAVPNVVPETQNTHSKNIYPILRVQLLKSLRKHKEFGRSFAVCLSEIPLINPLRCHGAESKREKTEMWGWNTRRCGYEHSPFKRLRSGGVLENSARMLLSIICCHVNPRPWMPDGAGTKGMLDAKREMSLKIKDAWQDGLFQKWFSRSSV